MDATAGSTRLTTSSSDDAVVEGAVVLTGGAIVVGERTTTAGVRSVGCDSDATAGAGAGAVREVAVWFAGFVVSEWSDAPNRYTAPPPMTNATTTGAASRTNSRRLDEAVVVSFVAAGAVSAGTSDCLNPHLHSSTRRGTPRPHEGHVQRNEDAAGCSMTHEGSATDAPFYRLSGSCPRILR